MTREVMAFSMPRVLSIGVLALSLACAGAQEPQSSSEQLLLQPATVPLLETSERVIRRQGFYGSAGILVAPPILYEWGDGNSNSGVAVLPPLPAPWVTIGYRRANDVSWQTSFLLVPLYIRDFGPDAALSTTGFDIDRISRNRSPWEGVDLRWQVGLRIIGIGVYGIPIPLALGPHVGLRWERPISETLSINGWGDVGLLPSRFNGFPLVDLRSELGFTWRPAQRPGFSLTVAAFQETVGFGPFAFMTPGITTRVNWNY